MIDQVKTSVANVINNNTAAAAGSRESASSLAGAKVVDVPLSSSAGNRAMTDAAQGVQALEVDLSRIEEGDLGNAPVGLAGKMVCASFSAAFVVTMASVALFVSEKENCPSQPSISNCPAHLAAVISLAAGVAGLLSTAAVFVCLYDDTFCFDR